MTRGMVIDREEAKLQTMAQVQAFLAGTHEIALRVPKAEHYWLIERVLKQLGYAPLTRCDKGGGSHSSRIRACRGNR